MKNTVFAAKLAALVLLICVWGGTLSGCALLPASVDAFEEQAANAVVASAERTICRNIPIGTWMRHYGHSAESRAAWNALCAKPATAPAAP
jgi:hypothetical protein